MKNAQNSKSLRFVADGQQRALAGAAELLVERRSCIEAEIFEKYSLRLAQAGMFHRFWLRLCMKLEIRRRMKEETEKFAPRDGLYATTREK
ncbi:MAG: hypothetical protein ACWGMZ_11800 [Thermoguttaceae bacterium]